MTATLLLAALVPERRCVLLLLLALCVVCAAVAGRSHWLGSLHTNVSLEYLADTENRSPEHGFVGFRARYLNGEGEHAYFLYNRFPIGGYVPIKAAMLSFQGDLPAQRQAARALMLAFFGAAMFAAYFSLKRLSSSPSIALAATLLGFSSYYALGLADLIASEFVMGLFAVLLTFHALVVFVQEGRFGQLLGKACAAVLIGWHVFALLLPFIVLGLLAEWLCGEDRALRRAARLLHGRHVLLGAAVLTVGVSMLALNLGLERAASTGDEALAGEEATLAQLPTYQSILRRTGWNSRFNAQASVDLPTTVERLFSHAGRAVVPYAAEAVARSALDLWPNTENPAAPLPLVGVEAAAAAPSTSTSSAQDEARTAAATALRLLGGLAVVATAIGIAFARHRILLATLALPGFCFGLLVPGAIATSPPEGVFHVGLALALYAVALMHGQRWLRSARTTSGCVGIALLVFSLSALQVSDLGVGKDPGLVDTVSQLASDKEAIHAVAPEQSVVVGFKERSVERYLLTGRIFLSPFNDQHRHRADFVLTDCIVGDEGLLTPDNRRYFLYERAAYDAHYAAREFVRKTACRASAVRKCPRSCQGGAAAWR